MKYGAIGKRGTFDEPGGPTRPDIEAGTLNTYYRCPCVNSSASRGKL
jgi:hypothetical protein